jgi:pyrroloquinoline-quinone synthase
MRGALTTIKAMPSFFRELEAELSPLIDGVVEHPFLVALPSIDQDGLRLFASEYALCNSYFPRCLAAVAANVPDDVTRLPLIENIWEEHGLGDLGASHRTMFWRFAVACGLPETRPPTTQKPLATTADYAETLLGICREGHFLEGMGALGPGTELVTGRQYRRLLAGLQMTGRFTEEDLVFFQLHIGLDDDHNADLEAAMAPWVTDLDSKERIRRGARRALELEIGFWDGLSQAVKQSALA